MRLDKCSREQFVNSITNHKGDSFAKTFVAKADMQKQWDYCIGCFDGDKLMGAIITTIGKTNPKVANLQLLHTFYEHRKKGVGKELTLYSFAKCIESGVEYFRVSAEPDAVVFYERIGFRFWGLQKSGCSLSIFRINGEKISEGIYSEEDPLIKKALYSGRKGSLASSYKEKNVVDLFDLLV